MGSTVQSQQHLFLHYPPVVKQNSTTLEIYSWFSQLPATFEYPDGTHSFDLPNWDFEFQYWGFGTYEVGLVKICYYVMAIHMAIIYWWVNTYGTIKIWGWVSCQVSPLIVGNSIPPANHAGRDPSGKSLQKTPASYRYMSYPPEPLAYLETNFLGEAVPVTFGCLWRKHPAPTSINHTKPMNFRGAWYSSPNRSERDHPFYS